MPIELVLAWAPICAPLAAWLVHRRGRSWPAWVVFGALLGPVGVALAALAPPGACDACGTPTTGFERTCRSCGYAFAGALGEASGGGSEPAEAAVAAVAPPPMPAGAPRRREPDPATMLRPAMIIRADLGPAGPRVDPHGTDATAGALADRPATVLPDPVGAPAPAGPSVAADRPPSPAPPASSAPPSASSSPAGGTLVGGTDAGGTDASRSGAGAPRITVGAVAGGAAGRSRRREGGRPNEALELVPLATGVYVSGVGGLVVGARYAVGKLDADLAVIGPIDVGSNAVVFRRPAASLDATILGDRLLLTFADGRARRELTFTSVAVVRGVDLVAELAAAIGSDA